MADDRTFEYNAELQGLQGDAIVDLWILDLKPLDATLTPAERYVRFCNWVVADGQPVAFASQVYTAIPYKATGFTYQTEGVPPSPSLTISNIGLEFTALVNEWNDLIGAKLIRRRVLAKHLDGGSQPDGSAHWPDETWFIQQKESETKLLVTFKLSTAFDLDGIMLPRRRALRYTCPWSYRGEGCDYVGPPVADVNDNPLTASTEPVLQTLYDAYNALPGALSAYQTAESDYGQAKADTANAQVAYNKAVSDRNAYNGEYKFQEEKYVPGNTYWKETDQHPSQGPASTEIKWNGNTVSSGDVYRKGAYKTGRGIQRYFAAYSVYAVQKWYLDTSKTGPLNQAVSDTQSTLTAAQNAEATALTDYNTAKANYEQAVVDYQSALSFWQASALQDTNDVCGKRLSSCRLRFFDPVTQTYQDLNYGGFPGLSL